MINKFLFFLGWVGIFILSITGIVCTVMPNVIVKFNPLDSIKTNVVIVVVCVAMGDSDMYGSLQYTEAEIFT